MRRSLAILAAGLTSGALLAAAPASAQTYACDPGHTEIRASWMHAGFSRQSLRFNEFTCELKLDEANIANSTLAVTIKAASLSSGVKGLDDHLKSKDFFEVDAHPEIKFVSNKVEKTSDTTATVTGDVTIKGKTAPFTMSVTLVAKGEHPVGQFYDYYKGMWAGFSAKGTFKRSTVGVEMMVPVVPDDIEISVDTEMKAQ